MNIRQPMFRLTFLLLISSLSVSAQFIKGQILIYGTEDPLPNASVYYDGMYKGGISDENGNFRLAPAASEKTPIIISVVGYYSTSIADYTSTEFIKIYLQPKIYALDPVVVTFDGMTREEKEAIFKKEFIGVTDNAAECEILNMDDINLVYNRRLKTVKAFASDPILLYNKALGFKITYYLNEFEYLQGSIYFAGNYFFEPDTTLKGKDLSRIEKRRKEAYLGSRMHFIRAVYNDQLAKEGYRVMSVLNKPVNYKALVVDSEDGKNIFMKSRLVVIYKENSEKVTFLDKRKDFTYIDISGFYDPAGITWSGYMANQRIGDLLPFEYGDPRRQKTSTKHAIPN